MLWVSNGTNACELLSDQNSVVGADYIWKKQTHSIISLLITFSITFI